MPNQAQCPVDTKPDELWAGLSPGDRYVRERVFRLRAQASTKRARAKALIERAEELEVMADASEARVSPSKHP